MDNGFTRLVTLVILFLKDTKTHPQFSFLLLVLGHVCIESFPLLHRVTRVENSHLPDQTLPLHKHVVPFWEWEEEIESSENI